MPQIRPPRTSHPRRTRARTASPTTAASAAPPETRVRSNEDLQIDPRNANRGTPRGRALLESLYLPIRRFRGYSEPRNGR